MDSHEMEMLRYQYCPCWNISGHAQKRDYKHMEDVTKLRFTNRSLRSEADRVTVGIMVLESGITRRNCLRLRHLHIFGGLTIKIYTHYSDVLHNKRFYMIEFNLLDERKLEKSSACCELKMFLFLLFVLGTTKSGISHVIFWFQLFPTQSILRNKLCCYESHV